MRRVLRLLSIICSDDVFRFLFDDHDVTNVAHLGGFRIVCFDVFLFLTPYANYSTERQVLKRKEERDQDRILQKATSREELESATVTKMKTVTGADEDVCVAILRNNSYDLKTSIETFFLESS